MVRLLLFIVLCGGLVSLADAAPSARDGMELLRKGRYRQAVEPLRQARKQAPRDPQLKRALAEAYLGSGLQLLREGNLAEAETMVRAGRELQPKDGRFSLSLGWVLFRQGQGSEAEALMLEALRQSGPSAEVYRGLAQVCYAEGRLEEAQGYVEQAAELQPEGSGDEKFLAKVRRERKVEEKMVTRREEHFSISYVDGGKRLGSQTLAVLEEAYEELGTRFNVFPSQAVAVILYGRKDFYDATGAPGWAGGWYDGKIRVPVGGLGAMNDDVRRVLYHEYAHVLIHQLTGGNIPQWLNEGLAQAVEGKWPAARVAAYRKAHRAAGPVPWERLEGSFNGFSTAEATAAYQQSRDFVLYLLDRYGWERMLDLLQALGRRKPFDEAADRFLLDHGEDFWMVEEDWRARRG